MIATLSLLAKQNCKKPWIFLGVLCALLVFGGCKTETNKKNQPIRGKAKIVCTTGIIADCIQRIVGNAGEVEALMGVGVDPHLYKPGYNDLKKLEEADIIIANGLHLEGKMQEVLASLSNYKRVIFIGNGVSPVQLLVADSAHHTPDPHIWFSIPLWMQGLNYATSLLQGMIPSESQSIGENWEVFQVRMLSTHKAVQAYIQTIPAESRVLVTAHDAFRYFGKTYGIEVRGLQGISTLSEYGIQDVTNLIDLLVERKIKTVFPETSIPKRSVEAIAEGCRSKGHLIWVGESLFSDALDSPEKPAGTYLGMVEWNAKSIAASLR